MTELLAQFKAKRDELGTNGLAEAIGVKASAVRMVATGNYPNPAHVLAKFQKVFTDRLTCPFIQDSIDINDCKQRRSAPRPFGGSAKLAWWETCQTCPQNQIGEK